MITEETAIAIARAHAEIRAAEKLLGVAEEALSRREPPNFRDSFGRVRHLQLGVPIGDNAHRLYDVDPAVAAPVLRAHIAQQRARIDALTLQALAEAAPRSATSGPEDLAVRA